MVKYMLMSSQKKFWRVYDFPWNKLLTIKGDIEHTSKKPVNIYIQWLTNNACSKYAQISKVHVKYLSFSSQLNCKYFAHKSHKSLKILDQQVIFQGNH